MTSMISEFERRHAVVPKELLNLALSDVMVKAHIDSFVHGNYSDFQDMLIKLALALAAGQKHYFDHAVRLTNLLPPDRITVGASIPVAIETKP